VRVDGNGLPMHGLLAGVPWHVERHEDAGDAAVLAARLRFGTEDGLTAAFPFPHELELEAELRAGALTVTTTVRASEDSPVPIAFGFHPYLRLPGVDRRDWEIEAPVGDRLRLDEQMLPTGEREPAEIPAGPLGSRTFDDAYLAPEGSAPFVLAGGGRRIELAFLSGYPYAQVFAPAEDDVVAYEPMTAPTNALVTGGPDLPVLAPGDSYRAAFAITVSSSASRR
jgi:galactose mutarotase-like enzyme